MSRRVLLFLGCLVLPLGGCGSDPFDIDDPDLFNGAWTGSSTLTLYDPDTGAVVCNNPSTETALRLSSPDASSVSATLEFSACNGQPIPVEVWEASGCRVGSGPVGISVACGSFDPATSAMSSFTVSWFTDGSPTELTWQRSDPPSGGGSPNLSGEAEGILSR